MLERYQLVDTGERLELRDTHDQKIGAVYVDFTSGKAQHRLKFGGGKGQALAKAIGLHKRSNPVVIDATAGLGRESFVLASLGCDVTLLERNDKVHALLEDGLRRAEASTDGSLSSIISRMNLVKADAQQWLLEQSLAAQSPDVVYIDPMFPERNKSALVQKEMRFFHEVVGDDADAVALVAIARRVAKHRVVVKRPRLAEQLADSKPAFVITGKTTRYDVYLPLVQTAP